MSEVVKDSAIKLFGTTISLPRNNEVSATAYGSSSEPPPPEDCSDHCPPSSSSSPREVSSTREHAAETDKEAWREELTSAQDEEASHQSREELKSPTSSSGILENPKTPSTERETCLLKSSKVREQSDTKEEKGGKKPEKIIACPRCKSMDTKFCYYNNYNVNQPRHFCKNCLRYWTAGGTMRNVPVGAGRRKNKNSCSSASHYRQIMVPETLQTPNGSLHSAVLTFGSNSPLSDSIASVFDLAEKSQSGVLNGFHSPTKQNNNNNDKNNKNNNNDNGDDDSIGASVMKASTPKRDNATSCSHEESVDRSYQAFTPQLCFQGSSSPPSSSWSYPWNAAMSTPSAFCQQSYHPVPLYPTPALWRCMPPSWSVHSISPKSCVNYQSATSCGPNSRTLGKHSREGNILFQTNSQKEKPAGSESSNNTENNSTSRVLLIPKTLRIDDPTEAAKSSIWSTLGIKNENENGNSGGGGLFNAFAYKGGELGDEKNHVMVEASSVLQANPAALTRSLIFHERT